METVAPVTAKSVKIHRGDDNDAHVNYPLLSQNRRRERQNGGDD